MATHEKIIKRADGSKVRIAVHLTVDWHSHAMGVYSTSVETCAKGKRTWKPCLFKDDYSLRRLDYSERLEMVKQAIMETVSPEEILEVKMELWQKLKPELEE